MQIRVQGAQSDGGPGPQLALALLQHQGPRTHPFIYFFITHPCNEFLELYKKKKKIHPQPHHCSYSQA